jgi:hypothetical protein
MPMDSIHRTYHYNAHGSAFSGHFTRPFDEIIEVQAGMSLAPTGGYGSVRVENFRFKELVSFDAATTQVSGSKNDSDNSHSTLVSTTVEGLNILGVITADLVIARLATHHPHDKEVPSFTFLGSHFENLRVAGCSVTVELDQELFQRIGTFEAVKNEFETNSEFRKMAEDPFGLGQPQKLADRCGVLYCSLVKDIKTTCPGIRRRGQHILEVPEFGRIFLAEVLARNGSRAITMLRFELGSTPAGHGSTANAQGNGQPVPPVPPPKGGTG